MTRKVDYLIIGQGLAGSLLAWELIARNYSVMVVDPEQNNASKIAAGIINPISGMRFVLANEIDVLLPVARQLYQHLADFFHHDVFVATPMLRLLPNEAAYQQVQQRLTQAPYKTYFSDCARGQALSDFKSYAYVHQQQTGYVLLPKLLASLKAFLCQRDSYLSAYFDYSSLQITPQLRWQDFTPKQIVFCEGYLGANNPWFSWLPFQLAKGEILTLRHDREQPKMIINYGHWVLPCPSQQLRVGATFSHQCLNTLPTVAAKDELLHALRTVNAHVDAFTCLQQDAHIRPCTRDKQPFLGCHPRYPQLLIFNGFGAKGSLYMPWYSQQFAKALTQHTPFPADIQRFYARHFPC
ncbi:MAG: NAD(P)/FAD-dependent oxidoreductase [Methylovulum sp.]|jgi:glycine/D-amino acid oxidase-like deaminating enzyme